MLHWEYRSPGRRCTLTRLSLEYRQNLDLSENKTHRQSAINLFTWFRANSSLFLRWSAVSNRPLAGILGTNSCSVNLRLTVASLIGLLYLASNSLSRAGAVSVRFRRDCIIKNLSCWGVVIRFLHCPGHLVYMYLSVS
jgi:hypothetical protein